MGFPLCHFVALLGVVAGANVEVDLLASLYKSSDSPDLTSAGWAAVVAEEYINSAKSNILSSHNLKLNVLADSCSWDVETATANLVEDQINSTSFAAVGPSCHDKHANEITYLMNELRERPYLTPLGVGHPFSLRARMQDKISAAVQLTKHYGWTTAVGLYDTQEHSAHVFDGFRKTFETLVPITKDSPGSDALGVVEEQQNRIIVVAVEDCSSLVAEKKFKALSDASFVFIILGDCDPPTDLKGGLFSIHQNTCTGSVCTTFKTQWTAYSTVNLKAAIADPTTPKYSDHQLMWDGVLTMAETASDVGTTNLDSESKVTSALKDVSITGCSGPIKFNTDGVRTHFTWEAKSFNGGDMGTLATFAHDDDKLTVDTEQEKWQDGSKPEHLMEDESSDMFFYIYIGAGVVGGILLLVLMYCFGKKIKIKKKKHIVISYNQSDREFAFNVKEVLQKANFRVWIDDEVPSKNPETESRRKDRISAAIQNASSMVFVMSPTSVGSKDSKEEIYFGINCDVPMFPVLAVDCWNDLSGGMKLILQRLQWIFFIGVEFKDAAEKLVNNIKTLQKSGKGPTKQGHEHKGDKKKKGKKNNRVKLGDDDPKTEIKPCDVYICYDSTDTSKGLTYAAFACKLGHHLRDCGLSVVLSARKEIKSIDFEKEYARLSKLKKEGGGEKQDNNKMATIHLDNTNFIPGSVGEEQKMNEAPKKRSKKKKGEETDPFLYELATAARARKYLKRESEGDVNIDTFEVNSLQIDETLIMVFLLSPDAMQSGEMVDELHYTYECSKRVIVVKAISGQSTTKNKIDLKGSVGIMLQSAETVDFGRCESVLNWDQRGDEGEFEIALLDLKLAVVKAKKDTIMEKEHGVGEDNALLNSGDKASSNQNMVRLKKANLI